MHEDESNFVSALGTAPEIPFYSAISWLLAAVNLLQLLHGNFKFNEILQANIFIRQNCHGVSTKSLHNDSADSSASGKLMLGRKFLLNVLDYLLITETRRACLISSNLGHVTYLERFIWPAADMPCVIKSIAHQKC